jgi:hypothetical protein
MAATLHVYIDADDVTARLDSMGLTIEPLVHAARRWYLSWVNFTANHPPFAIGIAAWMEAVAALREGLLPLGWVRSDEKNYALVIHPDGSMAINIASGDAGTGIPTASVSNKAPKGISTADAISVNQVQLELDLPVPDMPHVRGDEGPLTWFLLLHRSNDCHHNSRSMAESCVGKNGSCCRPFRWTVPMWKSWRLRDRISISM